MLAVFFCPFFGGSAVIPCVGVVNAGPSPVVGVLRNLVSGPASSRCASRHRTQIRRLALEGDPDRWRPRWRATGSAKVVGWDRLVQGSLAAQMTTRGRA